MSDAATTGAPRARFAAAQLRDWTAAVLATTGVPAADARLTAEVLVDADLSGVETHGLANLGWHWHYLRGLRAGAVNPRPRITVLRESTVTAAWDADRGLGPVVAHRAMARLLESWP